MSTLSNVPLLVGRPNLGEREKFLSRVEDILDRRWLSNNGKYVQEFEARVAAMVGVKHCVMVCNATVGLELAVRALGLGGEVIVPSFTFIATVHCLQSQQITPVFCDVDPLTHNIDADLAEKLITPRTTAILATHLWGRGAAVKKLQEVADRHGLKLLYDAAHAFGCSTGGQMIGGFGNAEIFSFHATKFINSLEGGAVTTNDDELAANLRRMKNFGFIDYDKVVSTGTNGKMNEISAAMGITNLESLDEIVAINKRNYDEYRAMLAGVRGISVIDYSSTEKNNYQYLVIEVDPDTCPQSRDGLVRALHAKNIIARKYFWPGCHRMEPYRTQQPEAGLGLPETERLVERVIVLPTGQMVDVDAVRHICSIIQNEIG